MAPANSRDGFAPAALVLTQPTVSVLRLEIGWFNMAVEIAAIHFRDPALAADHAAPEFGCRHVAHHAVENESHL
jgi:hypothetical protein